MRRRARMLMDLDQDIRDHIAMETQDNIARGMPPEEAHHRAVRKFGNITRVKEDTRDVWSFVRLERFWQDIRYASRMLRKSPGFTLVAILTLALGIGGNVAVYSVVRAVLLNPLPYPHPEQLVRVFDDLRGSKSRDVGLSTPELWDLRDQSDIFQDVSAIASSDVNLTGSDHPERIQLFVTSTNYFTMLGAQPQAGRVYNQNDEQPGFIDGVVLSDGFWRRTFGGDPNVLGQENPSRQRSLHHHRRHAAGISKPGPLPNRRGRRVCSRGFRAAPFPAQPQRSQRIVPGAIGRLRPGLTIAQAQARLNAFSARLSGRYPADYPAPAGWGLRLVSTQEDLVGDMRTELFVLLGAVTLVLLIACVNLANLQLARSAGRQREIAVRLALGVGRGRLIGQLLAESILLSFVSGGLALSTVVLLKTALLRLAPASLPRANEIGLSPGVLLFAFFISILTGVIFGLLPAIQAVRPTQVASLREGSRGSGSSKRQTKVSRILVSSEIALSLVLLIGAGLLLRSFWHLLEVHPGFEPHRLITAKTWLPFPNDPAEDAYRVTEKRAAFYREVLRRVSGLPGVERAAVGSPASLPMDGSRNQTAFAMEDRAAESERNPVAGVASVSSGYFDVLQAPLKKGRGFTEQDNSTGQPVAVINEALESLYWRDRDPIGQHLRLPLGELRRRVSDVAIVGVVGDMKSDGVDVAATPRIYVAESQVPPYGSVVYLRTAGDPGALGEAIRREVQAVDPGVPVFGIRSMDEVMAKSLAARRFALQLLGILAAIAFLLASIGIYGVMAFTFSRRIGEIGLRMALGARRSDILKIVLGEGARIVVFGVLAGLIGSVVLTRFLQTMLFDIQPTDPVTFSALTGLLIAVALLACLIPAQRATRVDPLVAVRHE